MGDGRIIRDALHGDIEISDDVRRIIDTRTFQRLRYIQQLATSHYAFPSATHTRFSHSLGAHHLATRLIRHLRELYPDAISDEDARLVPIAALLHDVGHPPFSHMFETPEVFATFRGHEEWGRLLMQDEECDLSGVLTELLGDSVDRLLTIMDGSVEPRFLSEIISSQLDVDRLDYLMRDQFVTGADVGSIDLDRILRSLRISDDGGLVVRRDRVEVVEGYLVTRWHMYQLVYFHKLNMLTQAYYVRSLARARHLHEHQDLRLSLRMRDMLSNRELTPLRYSQLTDAFVIADVFAWADLADPVLSGYATRLASRDGFHKRVRLPEHTLEQAEELLDPLSVLVSEAGFDAQHDLIHARMRKEGYLPYVGGILLDDGSDILASSPMIKSISGEFSNTMFFVPDSIRAEAEQLAAQLIQQ